MSNDSTTETTRPPVADWATDFDHTHPDYAARAPEIWDELRGTCPVAHTDRFGGAWLPTRAEDVRAIAEDTEHFTSRMVVVSDFRPPIEAAPQGFAPPITSDPPFHQDARRLLLPPFSPKAIAAWEDMARETCRELLDEVERELADGDGTTDAAVTYTSHIPVRIIAKMLGLPEEDGDKFRVFIHRILETPGQHADIDPGETLVAYLTEKIRDRREGGRRGDDLVSYLLDVTDADGNHLSDEHIFGTIALLLIAGIDTTWSAIGASLWHLAQHPEDRRRWVEDPDVRLFAVEEFLRFYAPVTMARLVAEDTEIGGCPVAKEDWVLLPFPAYNRDPDAFERADEFVIDRARNRHSAFGLGIHRCLGSNLARMELTVAIEEWMRRFPEFELADPAAVRWSTGQVRGPRTLPVRILDARVPSSAAAQGAHE
ncbi:MAG TPA: cytochrome P450 [Acidimicrobiales bacterium]|nr:cytochrome P450 [Acidimicrobiales bacterium]